MIFQIMKTAECQPEQEKEIDGKKDRDKFCFEIYVKENTKKVCLCGDFMHIYLLN